MNDMVSDAVDLPSPSPVAVDSAISADTHVADEASLDGLKAAVEDSIRKSHPVDIDGIGGPRVHDDVRATIKPPIHSRRQLLAKAAIADSRLFA